MLILWGFQKCIVFILSTKIQRRLKSKHSEPDWAFENDMRIQLPLSPHFYLLCLLLNCCDRNDVKHNVFPRYAVGDSEKSRISFSRCSFAFTTARNRFLNWPTISSMTFCDMLGHLSVRRRFKSLVLRHFRCKYLKANKVSKSEVTRRV